MWGTVAWAEEIFRSAGADSTLMVFDSCSAVKGLLESGYRKTDTMSVLRSAAPLRVDEQELEVRVSKDPGAWTTAYLRSFYGDEGLKRAVRPIVAALQDSRAVTLLEARAGGETAGVLAMFRTQGLLGVYCVGTVPEYRRMGAATALLARTTQVASAERRTVVLQTLESDGALRFYLRRGFEAMYSKLVLARKLK